MKNSPYSQSTINLYAQKIEAFIQWYVQTYGRDFDNKILPLHIRNFKSYLMTIKKLNAKTINNYLSAIKSYCNFLIEKGILMSNPVSDDFFIKVQESVISPCKLDTKSFRRLEEAIAHFGISRDIAIFYTLAYTGIRTSELVNLRLNDIIKDTLIIRFGKGHKQRAIPLNNTVKEALNNWLSTRPRYKYSDLDYLFIGERGKLNRSTVFKMIKHYCHLAKIEPVSPHQLRHYFCKNALEKGFNIVEVAALAGHSRITTTQIYIKTSLQELKAKMELL